MLVISIVSYSRNGRNKKACRRFEQDGYSKQGRRSKRGGRSEQGGRSKQRPYRGKTPRHYRRGSAWRAQQTPVTKKSCNVCCSSFVLKTMCLCMSRLFFDFRNNTCANGTAAFTNSETEAYFDSNRSDEFYVHFNVIARHAHFRAFR